jgi:hypothetical protein
MLTNNATRSFLDPSNLLDLVLCLQHELSISAHQKYSFPPPSLNPCTSTSFLSWKNWSWRINWYNLGQGGQRGTLTEDSPLKVPGFSPIYKIWIILGTWFLLSGPSLIHMKMWGLEQTYSKVCSSSDIMLFKALWYNGCKHAFNTWKLLLLILLVIKFHILSTYQFSLNLREWPQVVWWGD